MKGRIVAVGGYWFRENAPGSAGERHKLRLRAAARMAQHAIASLFECEGHVFQGSSELPGVNSCAS
jgi:hypothetical protein